MICLTAESYAYFTISMVFRFAFTAFVSILVWENLDKNKKRNVRKFFADCAHNVRFHIGLIVNE